jgi:large subunit ribosomal protein L3
MSIDKMIMGRKVGMTQLFAEDGKAVPVTVLEVGPCYVVQKRTMERDGYEAIQIGYLPYNDRDVKRVEEKAKLHETRRANKEHGAVARTTRGNSKLNLATFGHFKKANLAPLRHLKEFKVTSFDEYSEGMEITAAIFEAGEKVNIAGTSKGRGFAGVIKRFGFHGGKASHGSMHHRKPASAGATDAARVFAGAKRPGHMGAETVTTKGLTVIKADAEKNMLVVKGAVPGPNGGLVTITCPKRQIIERGKGKFVTFTELEK